MARPARSRPSAIAGATAPNVSIPTRLTTYFRNTGHLRTLLKTIAGELIRDGDQVALYSTAPSSVSVAWTSDRNAVDSVVKKIVGNGLKVSDILAITRGVTPTNEVDLRATVALSRVNEIIGSLDPTLDRRIGLIYISNGYVDRSPSLTRAGGRGRGSRRQSLRLDGRGKHLVASRLRASTAEQCRHCLSAGNERIIWCDLRK